MKVALFGGGPACLMTAYQLSEQHEVHVFEQGKRVGRKFLVAGNGGFNLTNSLTGIQLRKVYSNHPKLHKALSQFDTDDARDWLLEIGIETFVGSSGRVFPKKEIKPNDVLNNIMDKLQERGVQVHLHHQFIGFDENSKPIVRSNGEEMSLEADHYVFGLGGGSWSKTGSNSKWMLPFKDIGVQTIPFRASNCGLSVEWQLDFQEKFAGTPLKNIAITALAHTYKGEAMITEYGLEGNAIYPLVPIIREVLSEQETTSIFIDFKPNSSVEMLLGKITNEGLKPKNYGFTFNISKAVQEIAKKGLSKEAYLDPIKFATYLKNVRIPIHDLRPVEQAISTVGGISMEEIDDSFRLINHPHISIIGEMLDWDAPTGGFLLQGCFSAGYVVGKHLNV